MKFVKKIEIKRIRASRAVAQLHFNFMKTVHFVWKYFFKEQNNRYWDIRSTIKKYNIKLLCDGWSLTIF